MRAIVDLRDGDTVEGVLRLRCVPSLNYAQVNVLASARLWPVDPDTIVVLTRAAAGPALADPLRADPRWRPIVDLDEARAVGLADGAERVGGTWADLERLTGDLVAPLVAAGWTVVGRNRDSDGQLGDSAGIDLRRGAVTIEVERSERNYVVIWDLDAPDDPDGAPAECLFSGTGASSEAWRATFASEGWLDDV